jgi:hypothetical protein
MRRSVVATGVILAFIAAGVTAPEVVGWALTDDGSLDNPRVILLLRAAQALAVLAGATLGFAAAAPKRAASALRHPATRAGVAAAPVIAVAAFAVVYARRNQVDPLAHLNRSDPLAREVSAAVDPWAAWHTALLARDWPRVPLQQTWHASPADFEAAWRAGEWRLDGATSVPRGGVSWWRPASDAAAFAQQRQTFLFELLAADAGHADDARLREAIALVHDWRRHNPVWPEWHAYQWNDDVMANRLEAQLSLADRGRRRGLITASDEPFWLGLVVQHAEALLDPARHQPTTNHGLMQDIALLDVALAHPELDADGRWFATADARLAAYVERAVAPSGAFRELTPFYHYYACERLIGVAALARAHGHPLQPATEVRIRAMIEALAWFVQPDGTLPRIADTGPEPIQLDGWPDLGHDWPEVAAARAAAAGDGLRGYRRLDPGYIVVRPSREWQLVAVVGDPSIAHDHRDKLSFTLFAGGLPAIHGPGYANEFTPDAAAATRRTTAQATAVFDGRNQDLGAAPIDREQLWHAEDGSLAAVAVSATSDLVAGTRHRRTWLWGADPASVLIVDDLSGAFHDARVQYRLDERLIGAGPAFALTHGALRIESWIDGAPAKLTREAEMYAVAVDHPCRIVTRLTFGDGTDHVESASWEGSSGAFALTEPIAWTPAQAPASSNASSSSSGD